jgi:hypothetical protein
MNFCATFGSVAVRPLFLEFPEARFGRIRKRAERVSGGTNIRETGWRNKHKRNQAIAIRPGIAYNDSCKGEADGGEYI